MKAFNDNKEMILQLKASRPLSRNSMTGGGRRGVGVRGQGGSKVELNAFVKKRIAFLLAHIKYDSKQKPVMSINHCFKAR